MIVKSGREAKRRPQHGQECHMGRQRQRRKTPKYKHAVLEALPKLEVGGCRRNHDRVSIRNLISLCKPCSWDGHRTEGITHVGTKVPGGWSSLRGAAATAAILDYFRPSAKRGQCRSIDGHKRPSLKILKWYTANRGTRATMRTRRPCTRRTKDGVVARRRPWKRLAPGPKHASHLALFS